MINTKNTTQKTAQLLFRPALLCACISLALSSTSALAAATAGANGQDGSDLINGTTSTPGTQGNQPNNGYGGIGFYMSGGNSTLTNAGKITADQNASGTLANAVEIYDSNDTLILEKGYGFSGNVVANGSNNSLVLGCSGDASFNVSQIDDGTKTKQYQGFDNSLFKKQGASTWKLVGLDNGKSQTWNVNAGVLRVNGTMTNSDFTIKAGAGFTGGGSVRELTFKDGSTYNVETDSTSNIKYITALNASISNNVTVNVLAGGNYNFSKNNNVYILRAQKSVTGKFNVNSYLAFFTPPLTYTTKDVYLSSSRKRFNSVANTFNQRQAASGSESLGAGNVIYDALEPLSIIKARQAFDSLSGESHASIQNAMMQHSQNLHRSLSHHKQSIDGKRLWGQVNAQHNQWDGDGNAHQITQNGYDALFGYDMPVAIDWTLGVAAGFGRSNYDVPDVSSSATANQFHIGAYGGREWAKDNGTLKLKLDTSYTFANIDSNRKVAIGSTFNNSLDANYDSHTFQVSGELGYAMPMSSFTVEPYAGLSFVNSRHDEFRETGGAAALKVKSNSTNNAFATIGTRIEKPITTATVGSRLFADVAYQHEFSDNIIENTSTFATGGVDEFNTRSTTAGQSVGLVKVGIDYQLSPQSSLNINANAAFGSGYQSYGASLTFKKDLESNHDDKVTLNT